MKTALATALVLVAVFGAIVSTTPATAQSPRISTGVVTEIETGDNGELVAFSIVQGNGDILRFTTSASNPNTSYGLENRVGDRWVADHSSEPREAATRLRDQQQRLTAITVQSDADGVASSVVQAESADVGTNLGYLLAVVAITWLGIMAYVIYMSARQRTLSAELSRLRDSQSEDKS